ncbi:MAG: N-acetylmuramoyl-L-alanine amidase, partial [Saprospiraceae bacterium]
RKLMEQSARVYMIVQDPNDGIRNETYLEIDKDERCITGFPLVLNQRLRLTQTTDATNDLYRSNRKAGVADRDQLAVHIHVDSRAKDMRKDVYFYYQENNKISEAIARNLQQSLDKKYQEHSGREYTGTISCRNLFVMRNTLPSTVYMELGNIQNDADQKRLLFSSNRQALAEWLYSGIVGE